MCAAKLCAFREKDLNFVAALITDRLVERDEIARRIASVEDSHRPALYLGSVWLESLAEASLDCGPMAVRPTTVVTEKATP